MNILQTIQTVTGPILTIELPTGFQGKQVEVVITPIDELDVPADRPVILDKARDLIMEKPPVSPELRQRLREDPDLLKPSGYDDPFGPACPLEDWEALS